MASDRARHMRGPFTLAVAWGMFCADQAQWSLLGGGALIIEHRERGGCLGQVGIIHGPLLPERELGWLVFPEAEGHGFAFEAATALRAWAHRTTRRSLAIDAHGRLVMRIGHADLPGLTLEDLRRCFAHIGGDVTIGTSVMSRYHAWHPADHIHWALARPRPNGVAEVGVCFQIVEAFGRGMNHLVDVVEVVTRLPGFPAVQSG